MFPKSTKQRSKETVLRKNAITITSIKQFEHSYVENVFFVKSTKHVHKYVDVSYTLLIEKYNHVILDTLISK